MKKRIVSIILALVMLLSLLPTAAFAAGGDYEVDVLASRFSTVQYNGKDIMKLDFMIKTNNGAKVTGIQTALLSVDLEKYDILQYNQQQNQVANRTSSVSTGNLEQRTYAYSNYSDWENEIETTAKNVFKSSGTDMLLSFEIDFSDKNVSLNESTSVMSILLGLKTDVEWDELTSDSIRLATADEASSFNATGAVTINAPNAEGASDTYVYRPANGGEDSLTITPTLASDGSFTFADSTGGGDEGETTDGYEIWYELSGSTFNGTGDTDEYVDYNAGDTVTATVYVTNKSGEDVYLQACDIYLTYDNNLTYTGNTLTKGAAYNNAGVAYGTDGFSGKVSHIQAIGSTETSADISIELMNGATATLGTITFSISDAAVYDTQMPITLTTATNIGVGYEAIGNKTSYSPKNVSTFSGAEVMTTYTVTWKNEDDTVLETDTVGHNVMPSYDGETPTKAAGAQYTYTFAGWTPKLAKATADATYTATYTTETNSYTITWNNWDDTTLDTDTVEYGQTPSYSGTTPTRAEDDKYTYAFSGWNPTISSVTGYATYTATYAATAKQFTITLDVNGGTLADGASASITYTADDTVTLPTATLEGKNFGGWKVTTPGGNWTAESYSGSVGTGMYGDVTLTAIWSSKDYTVSVDENISDGTVNATNADGASGQTANEGETINVTVTPNAGYVVGTVTYKYTLDGEEKTGTITVENGAGSFTMPKANVTVTATFAMDNLSVAVDNTGDTNGTVSSDKDTANVGETVVLSNTPNAGYELDKYTVSYTDGDGNSQTVTVNENGTFTMPPYPVTVTASFKLKELAITIDSNIKNGTVVANDSHGTTITTAKAGDTVTLVPTGATGYELDAWTVTYVEGEETKNVTMDGNSFTMPAYEVSVSATFKATEYTITYKDGDTEISGLAPTTYTIVSTDNLPTYSKTNYIFKGWKVTNGANDKWVENSVVDAGTALTGYYGAVTLTAVWDEALDYQIEDYKYAQTGYKMLRIATNSNSNAYTFDGAAMYYTTESNYLVSGSDATGVFYTLISDTYVPNGKLNEAGMAKLVAGTEAAKTIDYTTGDINGDGVTNIADANIVYQMIVNGGGYYTDLRADNQSDTESRLMADMYKEAYTASVARATIQDVNAIVAIINSTN